MPVTIALPFIYAKIKGYHIKQVIKEWSLYPFFIAELLILAAQLTTWFDVYIFIAFASKLQTLCMVTLLVPFFKFRLYKEGSIGALCVAVGTLLNKIAIRLNGGKMPVFPTLSLRTGYTNLEMFTDAHNTLHKLGGNDTVAWFLTDFIDVGYAVLSIGDLFVHFFVCIILYAVIIRVCAKGDD